MQTILMCWSRHFLRLKSRTVNYKYFLKFTQSWILVIKHFVFELKEFEEKNFIRYVHKML